MVPRRFSSLRKFDSWTMAGAGLMRLALQAELDPSRRARFANLVNPVVHLYYVPAR